MRSPRLLLTLLLVVVLLVLAWVTLAGSGQPPDPSPSASASPTALPPTPTPTPTSTPTPRTPTATPTPTSEAARNGADPTLPSEEPGEDAPADGPSPEPERLTVRLSGQELSAVATQQIPAGAPLDAIVLTPRTAADGLPVLDARADVDGLPVQLTAEIAVEVTDGRLTPRLVDARVGPLRLPDGVRATIDDVLDGLADQLVDPGWVIDDVRVTDGALVVQARAA